MRILLAQHTTAKGVLRNGREQQQNNNNNNKNHVPFHLMFFFFQAELYLYVD